MGPVSSELVAAAAAAAAIGLRGSSRTKSCQSCDELCWSLITLEHVAMGASVALYAHLVLTYGDARSLCHLPSAKLPFPWRVATWPIASVRAFLPKNAERGLVAWPQHPAYHLSRSSIEIYSLIPLPLPRAPSYEALRAGDDRTARRGTKVRGSDSCRCFHAADNVATTSAHSEGWIGGFGVLRTAAGGGSDRRCRHGRGSRDAVVGDAGWKMEVCALPHLSAVTAGAPARGQR